MPNNITSKLILKMNNSKLLARLPAKRGKSVGILSNINKSGGVRKSSGPGISEKTNTRSRRSKDPHFEGVTPGGGNAHSILEHQLSLPSKSNLQPIVLLEQANLEEGRTNGDFENLSFSDEDAVIIIGNEEHNYSGTKMNYKLHTYSSPKSSQVEKSVNQITNINDLKKITPRVKLLNQESPSLQPTKKAIPQFKPVIIDQKLDETVKKELQKYCRTCAGIKLPLVDIFSEKGIQMKLDQQIKHLEDIKEHDPLSTLMCMDCICDLKMSYTFFTQIKKAEDKLKSIQSNLIEISKASADLKIEEDVFKVKIPLIQNDPDNLQNNGPRISAVYSANDSVDWENSEISKVKLEPEVPSDIESIEEFDPDDPTFNPDSNDEEDFDQEPKKVSSPYKKSNQKKIQKVSEKNKEPEKKDVAYKYDQNVKAYVKVEAEMQEIQINANEPPKPEVKEIPEITKVNLKRKLSLDKKDDNVDKLAKLKAIGPKDAKLPKLNVNDALNIKTEENGVMYVTVRGNKPNELLLVKVKKMDKNDKSKLPMKKGSEANKHDSFSREKDSIAEKKDPKDLIIEEQIEEYKKKREKVLGPAVQESVETVNLVDEEIRVKREIPEKKEPVEEIKTIEEIHIVREISNDVQVKKEKPQEKGVQTPNFSKAREKMKPPEVKVYNNPEDYNFRIEKVKKKMEDKLKKDWDDANPGIESPIDRLKRILGETSKGENLNDFLENLTQRKMIISKLKDEDVINLFQEKINMKKNPEPEEELKEEFVETDLFECDFCFTKLPSKELIDEHMKIHDVKIMHCCEDCNEEFSVMRLKKNHNVICIKKMICKYCDLMLDSKGKKRQHEQKHCDILFGQICEFCGEKFKHYGTLDQHIKTRHMSLEKVFECALCPKKFALKAKLSFHMKSVHTSLRAYLCEDCGADFKNPASLRHHRVRKHQPCGSKRECHVCNKMIPVYSMSKHMHTHKAYTIKCPHCDKMFKNTSTLKQHIKIHEDQRQYRCDTCGVGFNRRDGLRLHLKVHQKADSRGLKECSCQVCGEKFPNHSMLVIHRNRVHKDGRNYTCNICNRSMISTRSLEWHLAHIHNQPFPGIIKEDNSIGDGNRRVICFHCHKTFKTEMILRTHIKNAHMHKEPVKCLDCELTFTSEVRLRHHMMITHNRLEGTLECPHCPKRFVNQLRLKTHMISHSENRPFQCELCGFNLKTKIQLIKHHQNRHSDERPLQCRYCPWRCKQVSALVCHERTHTNERPYTCSVCKQRFKYLGDKNKHERRHESLGGSGFKRLVPTRGLKKKQRDREDEGDTSNSEQEQIDGQEEMESMQGRLVDVDYEVEEESIKSEGQVKESEDGIEYSNYQQDYEETSREASEAAEVILSMEDTNVYTEEVTAENIIEDDIIASEILQAGTVVHLEQQDEEGKFQVIPVVLSLPDLAEENSEVNLATASIMYNNE